MMSRIARVYIAGSESITAAPTAPKKLSGDEKTATLLDYQFNAVIVIILAAYAVLSISMGLDFHFSTTPVCNEQVTLEYWVTSVMATAVGCAILTCLLQVIRIASLLSSKSKIRNTQLVRVYIMLFVLCALAGLSKALTLFEYDGGICRDAFGVYSPEHQWVEWFTLVPLLGYIACAVEQKTHMDWFNIVMMCLLALMVLSGFLLVVPIPFELAVFFLVVSFLCFAIVTAMIVINYQHVTAHAPVKVRMSNYFSAKQTRRKAGLLAELLIIMWYYPIVWILGATQVLDVHYTFAAYSIGSIFGKVIFSSLVIESHVTLLYEYLITTATTSVNLGGLGHEHGHGHEHEHNEDDHLVDVSSPKAADSGHQRRNVVLVSSATDRSQATETTLSSVGAFTSIPDEAP